MSRVNSLIEKSLKPIAPIGLHEYTGSNSTYITYFTYNERQGIMADDDEKTTIYGVQIDVHSKGREIEQLAKDVKKTLKNIGFARTSEIELFNSTTKVFRKSIFFSIQLENTDEN